LGEAMVKQICNKCSKSESTFEVRGHHLLCAVCVRGGCKSPPSGKALINRLLKAIWNNPFLLLKITADIDISLAHYSDVYELNCKNNLPENFKNRNNDYADRRKDLEVCRVLGIVPNSVMPAIHVYSILFARQATLDGICRTGSKHSKIWLQCIHATKGYYEKIAGGKRFSFKEQFELGEEMQKSGLWAMIRPRSKKDMLKAKQVSAQKVSEASHLFIRPQHLLCILCTAEKDTSLMEDNLIELRKKMELNPDIPVTLSEGCCMACDPCNVYRFGEHICLETHIKNNLRDLIILERLDLAPGATLSAKKLYKRIYDRIGNLKEICGWRDGSTTAPFWAPCCDHNRPIIEAYRMKGFLTGKPPHQSPNK
jgi:hypothetical protein